MSLKSVVISDKQQKPFNHAIYRHFLISDSLVIDSDSQNLPENRIYILFF